MSLAMFHPVSFILTSPMIGAAILTFFKRDEVVWVRRIAAITTFIPLLLALTLMFSYDRTLAGYQFSDMIPWIPSLGISYHAGVDGISVVLVLLHALCGFTGVLVSYSIPKRVKEYYIFYLLLIGGVFGVFVSLDLFFFYLVYEMAVIPMFPLIGAWGSVKGGINDKDYATMKLTLYLTAGAVMALVGLLMVYFKSGITTFDIPALAAHLASNPLPESFQIMVFPLILIGFAVIAPMWPLHSWSPIGHAAAPSAVSMLHAGVLMKLGSFAIIRIALTLLPAGAHFWMPWVAVLCIMNIVYGGYVALSQRDMKFIIGYSSSSHMGYVLLGIATLNVIGVTGAVFLMFAHGIMTALAFALIGHIYDQAHTRMVTDFGGLAKKIPFAATVFILMAMASSGLPGFGNFVSEVMVFFGAWDRYPIATIAGVFGVVITATYMLRMVRNVFFGEFNTRWEGLKDIPTPFARLPYVILVLALMFTGIWPRTLTQTISVSTIPLIETVDHASNAPSQNDHGERL